MVIFLIADLPSKMFRILKNNCYNCSYNGRELICTIEARLEKLGGQGSTSLRKFH